MGKIITSAISKKTGENHQLTVVLRERLKTSTRYIRYIGLVKSIDRHKSEGRILLNFDTKQFPAYFKIGSNLQVFRKSKPA